MHECILHAQIPSSQHEHILKLLAGISAMQPIPIKEHHIIYKPTKHTTILPGNITGNLTSQTKPATAPHATAAAAAAGGGTGVGTTKAKASNELVYLSLIADLHPSSSPSVPIPSSDKQDPQDPQEPQQPQQQQQQPEEEEEEEDPPPSWHLSYKATPEITHKSRSALTRATTSIPIPTGDPRALITGLGYEYVASYILHGDRFVSGFVGVRIYALVPLPGPLETSAAGSTAGRVDPAGSWILEACVSVADGSKPELMDRAFGELDAFKDLLDGVVRFRGVDRLVLDSRVRNPGDGSGGAMDKMGMGRGIGVRT